MGLTHEMTYYEPEALKAYWTSTCANTEQVNLLREFFKVPDFYILHGHEGLYLGTLMEQRRKCLLVSRAKAVRLADALQSCIGVNPVDAKGLPKACEDYVDVIDVIVESESHFYKYQKIIKKYKKDIKRLDELNEVRRAFTAAQELAFSPSKFAVFICVDIEWHERNQDTILELGWSMWNNRKQEHWSQHWIVEENLRVVNGKWVPNRKFHFDPKFGTSQTGPLAEGLVLLQKDLLYGGYPGPMPPNGRVSAAGGNGRPRLVLVGHNLKHDREQLESLDVTLPEDMEFLDTIDLNWARLGGERGLAQVSVANLCRAMDITPSGLHNAGNDARYTMECFLALLKKPLPSMSMPAVEDEDEETAQMVDMPMLSLAIA